VVELNNNRILMELYWMEEKKISLKKMKQMNQKKKHNFEGILVVELDNNRILKEFKWLNSITTEF